MKRLILFLSVIVSTITSNAQFTIEPPVIVPESGSSAYSTYLSVIPKDFCQNNTSLIEVGNQDNFCIYDCHLSIVRSINIDSFQSHYFKNLIFIDYDEGATYHQVNSSSSIQSSFRFSQTLFNYDEKFEYVETCYLDKNDHNTWGTYVFNEDGEVVMKLDIEGEFKMIMKIGGNIYIVTGSSPYRFYKIDRNQSTNVSEKKAFVRVPDNSIYNIKGQRVDKILNDGIYIQNGKKVVLKK